MNFSPKNDNHTYIAFLCMCSIGNKQSFKEKKVYEKTLFFLFVDTKIEKKWPLQHNNCKKKPEIIDFRRWWWKIRMKKNFWKKNAHQILLCLIFFPS